MTTGLQLMLAAGGLVGLAVALLLWRLVPAEPDLTDAMRRLSPDPAGRTTQVTAPIGARAGRERLGAWAMRTLPAVALTRRPRQQLAILRMSTARFYGEKVMFALIGLCLPAVLTGIAYVGGLRLPVAVPVVVSVALAVGMFFIPDLNVRDDATRARAEFARALGAYIDLVALERASGSGARQAMEVAASVGDSWVFTRLSEDSPAAAGPASPRGKPFTLSAANSASPSSTIWLTSCGYLARRAPRSTPSSAPAPPRCAQPCCTTNSARPTRSTNDSRSR